MSYLKHGTHFTDCARLAGTGMKYILPAFVLLGLIALGGAVWADPAARVGRLSFREGTVSYSAAPGEKWETATLNYPLTAGNLLSTGQGSRAEVHIGSSAIRLAADSEVSFDPLDDQAVQMRIDKGSASVRLRQFDQGQTFQVNIQTASISLAAPGSYRIDQKDSGEAVLTTREGDAEVTGGQATFHVQVGQAAVIPPEGPDAYRITSASPPDAWDQWVASRDSREDRVVSARYVSREMDGVEDLDNFGTWQIIEGYGPVWIPTAVPVGWTPYTLGHWVSIDPWGWTWVDYEPWGFAPFHYGRWAFSAGAWFWVPGPIVAQPVFAPALVTWVGGRPWRGHPPDGEHISWVPLRPRQPFHPWYRASISYVRAVNGSMILRPRFANGPVAVRPFIEPSGLGGSLPGRVFVPRGPEANGRPEAAPRVFASPYDRWSYGRPGIARDPRWTMEGPPQQALQDEDPELLKRWGR